MRRGWGIVRQVGQHSFSVLSCVLSLHDGTQHKVPGYDYTIPFICGFSQRTSGKGMVSWHGLALYILGGGGANCRNQTARPTG